MRAWPEIEGRSRFILAKSQMRVNVSHPWVVAHLGFLGELDGRSPPTRRLKAVVLLRVLKDFNRRVRKGKRRSSRKIQTESLPIVGVIHTGHTQSPATVRGSLHGTFVVCDLHRLSGVVANTGGGELDFWSSKK